MEFRKVAESVLTDEAGELLLEDVVDSTGHQVLDADTSEPVRRRLPDPDGSEVFESTERFDDVDAKAIAEALKAFRGRSVEMAAMVAGGVVQVRVARSS